MLKNGGFVVEDEGLILGIAMLMGAVVGIVLELVPWGMAQYKKRPILGGVAFALTAMSGLVGGLLLAVPMMIVFTLAAFWVENLREE